MLENILSELTNNHKKEIGKYALVFCGGAVAGFLIKKTLDTYLDDMSKEIGTIENENKNQIDISDLDNEILIEEDELEDI
ncbi:MAG: hypothetical protein E7Z85_01855 [Methanosphaera stadtmanae]|nr:hypothetical protein [Methanosphaera stadtmanae]